MKNKQASFKLKVGMKVWDKNNLRVVTIKELFEDRVLIEEDEFDWGDYFFSAIPPYVQKLLDRIAELEKQVDKTEYIVKPWKP